MLSFVSVFFMLGSFIILTTLLPSRNHMFELAYIPCHGSTTKIMRVLLLRGVSYGSKECLHGAASSNRSKSKTQPQPYTLKARHPNPKPETPKP